MEISGTLTVKHFLYKGLPKTFEPGKKEKYPIYVRLGLGKAQFDFRSDFQSFLANKANLNDVDLKEIGYKTEKEFDALYEKTGTEIGKAIETERKIIWEISDLLRKHNYNPTQKGGRQVINHFMKPLLAIVNEGCISLLKDTLYNTPKLNEVTSELQLGINWESRFGTVYKLLSFFSKGPLEEIMLKFKEASDLFPLIAEFEKFKQSKSRSAALKNSSDISLPYESIMSYQWKYYEMENEFRSFLKDKRLKLDTIDNTLSIVNYSLNRYFQALKIRAFSDLIFPSPSLKPLPLRS